MLKTFLKKALQRVVELSMMRFPGNPILKPNPLLPWEARQVFNAGAIYEGGRVHILYRAVGHDRVSRIGYASSYDGLTISEKLDEPVFEPLTPEEYDGCEDPRLTKCDDGLIYMAYTAVANLVYGRFQVGLTNIDPQNLVERRWRWGLRIYPFPGIRDKNAALLPRKIGGMYVLFHRIEPDICISYSKDLKTWYGLKSIMSPRPGMWDSLKIGIGPTPIEVSEGWLMIYHGVDMNRVYRLGFAILDRERPETVLYRCDKPILEPKEDYEKFGYVPNVVFSCGAVLLDDQLLVYYGGADTTVNLVMYDLAELIPSRLKVVVTVKEA